MFKKRKIIGSIMALVIIINLLLPATKALAANDGIVNAESKLNGVTYKMRPEVVTMPQGIDYELEEEEVLSIPEEIDPNNEIDSMAVKKGFNRTTDPDTVRTRKYIPSDGKSMKSPEAEPRWSREKEYTLKSITVDRNTENTLSPQIGEIYFDRANQSAMKVVGTPTTDASGKITIPVEQPELTEVVESIKIPEQTIPLSNDDIGYVNEEVRMVTDIYSHNGGEIESFATSDRKPMVEIDLSGLDLIDMSSDQDHKDAFEAKLKAIEDDPNLNGYAKAIAKEKAKEEEEALENERESELKYKAKVEITKGTLKVFTPTLTAYADWGWWGDFEAEATANIDVETDLLIDGDLNISKQVEILIYGYDIDFEIGRIYAGVYLVVGLDGQINFQIRVQQAGTIKLGVKAVGWLVPMAAYPIVEYNSKKFETAVTASGELKLWAYAMPKAGIEIFGVKALSAFFKIGLEANVKLDISKESQSVRLWVDMILQLGALVFGNNIDILDKRYNIYDRTWAHTSGEEIGGGTDITVDKAYAYLKIDKIDAARDIISGTAFRSKIKDKDLIPCKGENVRINITHADGTKNEITAKVEEDGKFIVKAPITPLDMVGASYSRTDAEYKYNATIPSTYVQLPYSLTYLYPDAFNSRISGEINGEKYGPNGFADDGDEVKFNKPIEIIVEKADHSKKTYKVTPNTSGEFVYEDIELEKGDKIVSQFVYEDAQVVSETKIPELGLIIYLDVKKDLVNKTSTITGSIQNLYGDEPYLGDVALVADGIRGESVVKATKIGEAIGIPSDKATVKTSKNKKTSTNKILERFKSYTKVDAEVNAQEAMGEAYQEFTERFGDALNPTIGSISPRKTKTDSTSPSSVFEFKDVSYFEESFKGVYVVIEQNGITLSKSIIPSKSEPIPPTAERAVVSPVEAYIEARINYAFNKDMKAVINKQKSEIQNENTTINISQNNSVAYTMSQIPVPSTNIPAEYSFSEDAIKMEARAGAGSISLSWNEMKDPMKVKGYNLYRGTSADGESLTPINSTLINSTKYVDKKVVAGTKYYYLCSVVYENGDEFIISNETSATPRITKR